MCLWQDVGSEKTQKDSKYFYFWLDFSLCATRKERRQNCKLPGQLHLFCYFDLLLLLLLLSRFSRVRLYVTP